MGTSKSQRERSERPSRAVSGGLRPSERKKGESSTTLQQWTPHPMRVP
ncbi:hypothetical protein [Halocatena pleomorpha]|nr:hypothetical protein [Halocatena pleomorpha]